MKQIQRKTQKMLDIEQQLQSGIEEILRIKFVDEDKTLYQIMDELDISYLTLLKWLDEAGIYSRRLDV